MAEDPEKTEQSGPAPGPEVPDEERFLSSEKQYPTKEAKAQALEEARHPKPELPHVPPFIKPRPSKPNWQPASEPEPQPATGDEAWAERVLARNRAERLTPVAQKPDTINAMAEAESSTETEAPPPAAYNPSEHIEAKGGTAPLKRILEAQKTVEPARVPGSSTFRVPPEAETLPPSRRTREKAPPAQPVPLSKKPPTAEDALRQQINKTPEVQPRQSFFGNLLNRIRGRA